MLLTWQNTNANAFSPLNNPSTLSALYLPGVGQTDAGAGACSVWADQSGNGNNLLAAGAARPTINSAGYLTFDGVANGMQTGAMTLAQPTVVTVLFRPLSWVSGGRVFDGRTSSSGSVLQFPTATPDLQAFAGSFSTTLAGPAVGTLAVIQAVFNGASSSLKMNNGTPITGDFGATSMDGFTLGVVGALTAQWINMQAYGASVRNANNSNVNDADLAYFMRIGGLS